MASTRRRATALLAIGTALSLTAAGLFATVAAHADDEPAPVETVAPSETPAPETPADEPPADEPPAEEAPADEPTVAPKPPVADNPPFQDILGSPGQQTAAALAPSATNSFSKAFKMTGFYPAVTFDTTTYTSESGEPRALKGGYFLRRTAWATWVAPYDGVVTLEAKADSGDDTGLNVYVGTKITKLKLVASNDQQADPVGGAASMGGSALNAARILSLPVKKGTTYRIQAGNAVTSSTTDAATGGFPTLEVKVTSANYRLPNDNLSSAIALPATPSTASRVDVIEGATIEGWEPTDNNETSSAIRLGSIWYKYTAPQSGNVTFRTCTFAINTTLAVFSSNQSGGDGWGDLQQRGFDEHGNDGCGLFGTGALVTIPVVKGYTYSIQVANTPGLRPTTIVMSVSGVFTYPYIASMSPTSGSKNGGTTVTISGQQLNAFGAPIVKFGSKTATVVSHTATSVVVKAPKQSKGTVSVTVSSGGNLSNALKYTYK